MSLQVWLPMNGNLNNQGLSGVTVTNNGATVDNNGKIGKCYSFGSNKRITLTTPSNLNSKNISFSVWVKLSSWNTSWDSIIAISFNSEWRGSIATLTRNNTDNGLVWNIADGTNSARVYSATNLTANVWTHLACTYDGSQLKIYVNGKLDASSNANLSMNFANTSINIGSWTGSSYPFTGFMNDIRIYDHCLSPLEVKQISQGLVCHYPLKSQYETGQANKYSGDVAEGYLTGNFTRTKLENDRGYNYKLTYTGTGSNMWFSMKAGNFSFTAGKKYYYSCKVRCHSTNFKLTLRASRSDNDWVTNSVNVLSKADGEWHEYYVSQTINSTYDRSGSTVTCNPTLEFYTENLATSEKVYSADFDIKDVQVIESDCYVPFIDNSMASSVVSDCSGYGNNGTKVGDIAWTGDSARYSGSYYFSTKSHYKIPCPLVSPQEFSCSFWVKPVSCGGYAIISSNYNNPGSGFWLAVNCEGSGLWFFNGNYARSNKGLLSLNTWYHVCFVFNKGIITWYQNGEVAGTTDLSSKTTTLGIKDYISIGNSFTGTTWNTNYSGNISDFRIYSTILSEEDVKSLYNTSASINKTGVLSAYEFSEFEEV